MKSCMLNPSIPSTLRVIDNLRKERRGAKGAAAAIAALQYSKFA